MAYDSYSLRCLVPWALTRWWVRACPSTHAFPQLPPTWVPFSSSWRNGTMAAAELCMCPLQSARVRLPSWLQRECTRQQLSHACAPLLAGECLPASCKVQVHLPHHYRAYIAHAYAFSNFLFAFFQECSNMVSGRKRCNTALQLWYARTDVLWGVIKAAITILQGMS